MTELAKAIKNKKLKAALNANTPKTGCFWRVV